MEQGEVELITGKGHKSDRSVCQCVVCRHGRGEVSDDYYKGYLQASLKEQKAFLASMRKYGYKPTSLSENSIGGMLAVIDCDADETAVLLDEICEKKA